MSSQSSSKFKIKNQKIQINPHLVRLSNDGKISNDGPLSTRAI
jgi:hypothetical protein